MKKFLLLCISAACASVAHAQSSATLYGIIDLGLTYANNVQTSRGSTGPHRASQIALTDAHTTGLSGSRMGLRGIEDLGGQLRAVFVLENGFMANTGAQAQGWAEFGRQAYVGLSSANLGTVTLGRQYDPMVESTQQFSAPYWAGYMSSHVGDVDNLANTNRVNNSIKYTTPDFHGLRAGALYSFGGIAGNQTQNQVWSLGASYNGGLVGLGMGYVNARNPNVSLYGNTPNKGASTANNIGSLGSAVAPEMQPVYAGFASANTLEIYSLGASLALSQTTVTAVWTNTRFEGLGSQSGPNPLHFTGMTFFKNAELGVRTMVTPALLAGAAFNYTQRSSAGGDDGARYMQVNLAVDYSLSKRTDLYALAAFQHATGLDSLAQPAVASISGFTPSATDKQVGVRIGIRHKF